MPNNYGNNTNGTGGVVDCPLDRVQFYKSLVQLMRVGRPKRESKTIFGTATTAKINPNPVSPVTELVYKQELRDLIWLEIKTWFADRTLIEEDSYLCSQRLKSIDTIQKIMTFNLNPSVNIRGSRAGSLDQSNASAKQDLIRKCLSGAELACNQSMPIIPYIPDKLPLAPTPSLASAESASASNINKENSPGSVTSLSNQAGNAGSHIGTDGTSGYTSDHDQQDVTPDLRTLIDQDALAASVAAKLTLAESNSVSGTGTSSDGSLMEVSNIIAPIPIGSEASDVLSGRKFSISTTTPTYNGEEDNCSCSKTLSRLCQNCVDKETEAIKKVQAIIDQLEEAEDLYPCTRALAQDYPLYQSKQFTARVKSMYLFINITRDLRQKIDLLARLFMIQNRSLAGWPVFDDREPDSGQYTQSLDTTPELYANRLTHGSESSNHSNISPTSASAYSDKMYASAQLNPLQVKQVHFKGLQGATPHDSFNSDKTMSAPESPDVHSITSTEVFHDGAISNSNPASGGSGGSGTSSGPAGSLHCGIMHGDPKENPFFPSKSCYRKYVDKALKNRGLRDINQQLSSLLRPLLYKVHAALKRPTTNSYSEVSSEADIGFQPAPPLELQATLNLMGTVPDTNDPNSVQNGQRVSMTGPLTKEYCEEISQHGVWSMGYQSMGLPTLHRPFLFVLRITLDVVHECLKLRLEQQPEQPSAFSIGQLIRECKEVLRAGVQIRQRYVNLARTVLGEGGSEVIEIQLDGFDEDLKTMLSTYLKYLEMRMELMQTFAGTNDLSSTSNARANSSMNTSTKLKSYLEEEWNFVRSIRPHIPGGESIAADKFCLMSSNFLSLICNSIRTGIDDIITDYVANIEAARETVKGYPQGQIVRSSVVAAEFRKVVLQASRRFKSVFQDASTRACQATALAKTLRKDLEIAAEFKIMSPDLDTLCQRLWETGHVRVVAPNSMNHLMFVPNYLQSNETLIWHLIDMTCGGRNLGEYANMDPNAGGYLVVIMLRDGPEVQWQGPVVSLEPTAESTISISHVEVNGLLLVAHHPSHLFQLSYQFQSILGADTLALDKRQTACNHATAQALTDLKYKSLEIQHKISRSLSLIYDQLTTERIADLIDPNERITLEARCVEVMHMGFKFGFEYEKNLTRLITGEARTTLSRQLLTFASQWMRFVMTKCERGRGLRPRWTSNGLQFLVVAMEPQFIQILTDEEYATIKQQLDSCLTHILGTSDRKRKQLLSAAFLQANKPYSVLADAPTNKPLASSLNFHRSAFVSSSAFSDSLGNLTLPLQYSLNTGASGSESGGAESPIKGTRLEEWDKAKGKLKALQNGQKCTKLSPAERIRLSCSKVEEHRDETLRDSGVIGSVSSVIIHRVPLHITTRKVPFAWQRGFKIGEGRFGKVYTAVNNTTGDLIAIKEIKLTTPNDHRSVKEAIDEIRTFEGIKHPRIIRYFGVEIHREEMYIFMEYCNEGSLDNAAQLRLPENIARKYTFQLLDAVNCLHENGIVHRDIKSANIFLTSEGNLKLGDFGCCTKLKSHTTMPGEVNAFVGTPAYMAPEVFTRNPVEGHGRAADIWSVGCVILEMLTGRQPWHDVDNPYQIMFRVGMGETPLVDVPDEDQLPVEGQSFINKCLQHDPRLRWSAGQLMTHPFTKVGNMADDEEEEENYRKYKFPTPLPSTQPRKTSNKSVGKSY